LGRPGALDDRTGQWVLGATLERRGELENLVLLESDRRHNVGELRITLGFGAGVIKHNGLQIKVVCAASPEQIRKPFCTAGPRRS
jgi:hypothetical protein